MDLGEASARLAAEQRARLLIDRQLTDAGWVVQSRNALNLFAATGVAVREVVMATGHGRADYLLYVDQKAIGVIEAKPEGKTPSRVEWQSAMYAEGLPADVRLKALTVDGRLPFVFEASGSETHFTNGYDPEPRARRVFSFPHRPRWPEPCATPTRIRKVRPGAARSDTSPPSTPRPCARRRSPRSTVWSGRWSSSGSTGRWCRWPPGRGFHRMYCQLAPVAQHEHDDLQQPARP